jgi:hypothetical protein
MSYSNCPTHPKELPDMCETCESFNNGIKTGHHTFLAIGPGYTLTEGTCLWYCSKECFNMSPVPTIDDGKYK